PIPAFCHHLIRAIEGGFHSLPCRLRFWDHHHRVVKTQDETLETLQQRVVQIASNAFPFRQALFQSCVQPCCSLPKPDLVQTGQQQDCRRHRRQPKRRCLVEERFLGHVVND